MPSKFRRAIPILVAHTGAPLFVLMGKSGKSLPMAKGIAQQAIALPERIGSPKQIRRALGLLAASRRYLISCAAEGAVRFNIDGTEAAPVTESERAYALAELAKKSKVARASGVTADAPASEQRAA